MRTRDTVFCDLRVVRRFGESSACRVGPTRYGEITRALRGRGSRSARGMAPLAPCGAVLLRLRTPRLRACRRRHLSLRRRASPEWHNRVAWTSSTPAGERPLLPAPGMNTRRGTPARSVLRRAPSKRRCGSPIADLRTGWSISGPVPAPSCGPSRREPGDRRRRWASIAQRACSRRSANALRTGASFRATRGKCPCRTEPPTWSRAAICCTSWAWRSGAVCCVRLAVCSAVRRALGW